MSSLESLKALANENRLKLVKELSKGKALTVTDAAEMLRITIAAASRHLQILEEAGILAHIKRGQSVAYRIKVAGIEGWVKALFKEL